MFHKVANPINYNNCGLVKEKFLSLINPPTGSTEDPVMNIKFSPTL